MAKQKKLPLSFIAELLVVFVGVYGAFELDRYQEERKSKKIQEEYFKSFYSELDTYHVHIDNLRKEVGNKISAFKTALENGERPKPEPLNLYMSRALMITQAGLSDDIFIQLASGLASSLSGGFDNVQNVSRMIDDFNQICNRQLVSNEPISFYNSNGTLKPQFHWYLEGLERIKSSLDGLGVMIEEGAIPATKRLVETFGQ